MLQISSDWLEGMRQKHMVLLVRYSRGTDTAELEATVGKTIFQISRDYGVFERHESRDYVMPAQNLVLAGAEVLPERGDRITETTGDKLYHYEVMAPGTDPCWRWSDPYRKTLRIHTKLVHTEEIP